jgi:hypothetical protein
LNAIAAITMMATMGKIALLENDAMEKVLVRNV